MASFFTSSGLILLCTNPCTSFWPCWSLWNLVSLFPGPLLLGIFLFGINNISFGGCLLQIFSMHSFTLMESGILLAMSVDHFVAIYSPLRYTIVLTILHISRMGVTIAFHGARVPTASSPEASALLQPQYPHTLLLPPLRSDQVALWRYPPQ